MKRLVLVAAIVFHFYQPTVAPAGHGRLRRPICQKHLVAHDPPADKVAGPKPPEVLDNPAFALPVREGKIAGWEHASGPGIKAVIDRAEGHERTLHLVSTADGRQSAPVIWVRSNQFPAPKTGRLSLTASFRVDDPNKQPILRLAIEGKKDGKSFYRRANIGASEDGQPIRPIQKEWSPYRFPLTDLPLEGITDLRVGFDLMGEGNVYIDDVSLDSSRPESATAFVIRLLTALSSSPSRP